jgi:ABC-type Fe3+-siderophore transport system permease subunit
MSSLDTSGSKPSGGFFLHVAPALLYAGVILYMGSIPDPPTLHMDFEARDKLMHAGAFVGMQLSVFRAVRWHRGGLPLVRQLLVAALLSSAFGATLEFWQALLPERSAEFLDWMADNVGAALGAGLLWLVYRRGDDGD